MDVNSSVATKSVFPAAKVAQTQAVTKYVVGKLNKYVPTTPINSKEVQDVVKGNSTDGNILSVSDNALVKAIEHVNKVMEGANVELSYSVHKATNTVVIKMIDKDTNEVIREIPSEKVLDIFAQRMQAIGLYVDERR